MCVHKEEGGRGFCDLHLFYIARLAKIGWCLLVDVESLVCRVLKARYFQNCDFLSANIGANPSYT